MTFLRCFQLNDINVKTKLMLSSGLLCLTFFLIGPGVQAQQTPAVGKMRLSKVEFAGLQRHSEADAIAASGLKIGQPVDIPTLEAAAQRLFDSGLFKNLSYRYRTTGDQAVVTFSVKEEKGAAAPVVFDNFVWFSDEELLTAVRQQIPSFGGTANDSATNGITKALQQLLQDRKISVRVVYMPAADLSSGRVEHVFSVEGVNIPICTLHFSGATAVKESDLIKNSKLLIADDYKRTFVLSFAQANLIPIYRERGHLRATFRAPLADLEPETTSSCKGGVSITLPIEEGLAYTWSKAEWTGNTALSNPELGAALGMKEGELANGLKIDKGLGSIQEAYSRKGHLAARLKTTPVFEDASQRVAYQIEVIEGSQYRMGMLTITGLSESTINRLKSKWKLRPSDVFDALYIKEFMKKEFVLDASEIGSPPKNVNTEIKPDREKLLVDVTITLK